MTGENIVVRLARVPEPGSLPADIFDYVAEPFPAPAKGEFVVKVIYQTIDAGSRGAIDDKSAYVIRTQPGDKLRASGTIGRIVETRHAAFPVGTVVRIIGGVRQRFLSVNPGKSAGVVAIDPTQGPIDMHIGMLGITGFTAWLGVLDICRPKQGETVLVSAAGGAVGSAAGQFAGNLGARVVGIAGGRDKCAFVRDTLGFDDCIDYRCGDLPAALLQACPNGVDAYFENVGGEIQKAVLPLMNNFGRIAMCGQVAQYSGDGETPGPNLMTVVLKRLELRGFLATDHLDRLGNFTSQVTEWYQSGRLHYMSYVVDGLENLHDAINALVSGRSLGPVLHRLGAD